MKIIYILIIFALHNYLHLPVACAKKITLSGTVFDNDTKERISGASVTIANTTYKTSSNQHGYFQLPIAVSGRYTLVVSALGYNTFSKELNLDVGENHHILVTRKTVDIEEVIVEKTDEWKKWGNVFLKEFIGESSFSSKTRILNPQVLRFTFNAKENTLHVCTSDIIKLKNNALGYDIDYALNNFVLDFNSNTCYYDGYAFFTSFEKISKSITRNRRNAYNASLRKFLKHLYKENVYDNGYIIFELNDVVNREWSKADSTITAIDRKVYLEYNGDLHLYMLDNPYTSLDSINYYRRVIKQQLPVLRTVGKCIYEPEILNFFDEQTGIKEVYFSKSMYIKANRIFIDRKYNKNRGTYKSLYDNTYRSEYSILNFSNGISFKIDALGNLFPMENCYTEGFWGWYTKLATMLPIDYEEIDKVRDRK